jgi:hypothetical protein
MQKEGLGLFVLSLYMIYLQNLLFCPQAWVCWLVGLPPRRHPPSFCGESLQQQVLLHLPPPPQAALHQAVNISFSIL